MTVKTFHDIYHNPHENKSSHGKLYKCAAVELQEYLEANSISNYQISHTVERDKYGRLHTHILLVHE